MKGAVLPRIRECSPVSYYTQEGNYINIPAAMFAFILLSFPIRTSRSNVRAGELPTG